MSDRLTVDTITSDALDALYDERDALRKQLDDAHRRNDSRDALAYAVGPLIDRPFRSLRPKPEASTALLAGVRDLSIPEPPAPGCTHTYGQRCPNCRD